MKLRLALLLLLLGGGMSYAESTGYNKSLYISGATSTGCVQAAFLDKIMTGVSTSAGVLVVYNSTWTASGTVISSYSLTVGNPLDFNDTQVKGICYQAVTPTNGVNIIYKSKI